MAHLDVYSGQGLINVLPFADGILVSGRIGVVGGFRSFGVRGKKAFVGNDLDPCRGRLPERELPKHPDSTEGEVGCYTEIGHRAGLIWIIFLVDLSSLFLGDTGCSLLFNIIKMYPVPSTN